jgi:hypothetical protein
MVTPGLVMPAAVCLSVENAAALSKLSLSSHAAAATDIYKGSWSEKPGHHEVMDPAGVRHMEELLMDLPRPRFTTSLETLLPVAMAAQRSVASEPGPRARHMIASTMLCRRDALLPVHTVAFETPRLRLAGPHDQACSKGRACVGWSSKIISPDSAFSGGTLVRLGGPSSQPGLCLLCTRKLLGALLLFSKAAGHTLLADEGTMRQWYTNAVDCPGGYKSAHTFQPQAEGPSLVVAPVVRLQYRFLRWQKHSWYTSRAVREGNPLYGESPAVAWFVDQSALVWEGEQG